MFVQVRWVMRRIDKELDADYLSLRQVTAPVDDPVDNTPEHHPQTRFLVGATNNCDDTCRSDR